MVDKEGAKYERIFLLRRRHLPATNTTSIELWNIVWPFAIGGCRLGRPTIDLLLKNGDWEVLELEAEGEPWSLMPRIWGRLRKVARGQGIRTVTTKSPG